jgi:hypothetical protein
MVESNAQGTAMDYPEHERTYDRFVTFVKWGTIAVCAIVVGMAIFLL